MQHIPDTIYKLKMPLHVYAFRC